MNRMRFSTNWSRLDVTKLGGIRAIIETICLLKATGGKRRNALEPFLFPLSVCATQQACMHACVCVASAQLAGWKGARNARRIGTVSISETERGRRAVNAIIIVIMGRPNQSKQATCMDMYIYS